MVNSAIYCMQPEIFDLIPAEQELDLPRDIFPAVLAREGLFALPIKSPRVAVDSVEALCEARVLVRNTSES